MGDTPQNEFLDTFYMWTDGIRSKTPHYRPLKPTDWAFFAENAILKIKKNVINDHP